MELLLTDAQLLLITMIFVPILVEIYRLIVNHFNVTPSKLHMTFALSGVGLVLAFLFNASVFAGAPPIVEPIGFLLFYVFAIGRIIGLAKIIYDVLWDKVFDKIALKGVKILTYRLPTG